MAAMAATSRPGNRFARSYGNTVAAGKLRKVALGAIMRRMPVTMRAMISAGTNCQDERSPRIRGNSA